MTGRRRAAKFKKNSDYLSKLPNDVLYKITSMLDIKDAVKTSMLSKSWRYVWVNRDDFILNHSNVLGLNYNQLQKNWEGSDDTFVKFVDQIMLQMIKSSTTIKCFRLQFQLEKKFSPYINRWIRYAIRNGLETLDLDLSAFSFNVPPTRFSTHIRFQIHDFSLLRTVSEDKGSLKHMRVVFCNLQCRSSFQKFDSLVSLHLESVDISNFQMTKILESCPSLEKLIMCRCSTITKLRIDNGYNNVLKILSLKNIRLKEIDLSANNLISLELQTIYSLSSFELMNFIKRCPLLEELRLDQCLEVSYLKICDSTNSHLKILSLKKNLSLDEIDLSVSNLHTLEYISEIRLDSFKIKAPRLVNLFISEDYIFCLRVTRVCLDIPMLENLILLVKLSSQFFKFQDHLLPNFSNVRQLVVCDFSLFNDDVSPLIYYLLKCLPLLKTLELMRKLNDPQRKIPEKKCPNGTITKLILNGYWESQVDLVKYLLENLTGLKVLVISPFHEQYASLESVDSKTSCDCNWLHKIIPPSVHIDLNFET